MDTQELILKQMISDVSIENKKLRELLKFFINNLEFHKDTYTIIFKHKNIILGKEKYLKFEEKLQVMKERKIKI